MRDDPRGFPLLAGLVLAVVMGAAIAEGGGAGNPPPARVSSSKASDPCGKPDRIVRVARGVDEDGRAVVRLSPDPDGLGDGVLAGEPDLDGRGGRDLNVSFPGTHGSGGVMCALYVHCGGDRYAAVWGPTYAFSLEVRRARANGWREVRWIQDNGRPESPGTYTLRLRFRDGRYQPDPRSTPRKKRP